MRKRSFQIHPGARSSRNEALAALLFLRLETQTNGPSLREGDTAGGVRHWTDYRFFLSFWLLNASKHSSGAKNPHFPKTSHCLRNSRRIRPGELACLRAWRTDCGTSGLTEVGGSNCLAGASRRSDPASAGSADPAGASVCRLPSFASRSTAGSLRGALSRLGAVVSTNALLLS